MTCTHASIIATHAKMCTIEAILVCNREQEIDINQTKNEEQIEACVKNKLKHV